MLKTVTSVLDAYRDARANKHLVRDMSKELEVKFYLDDFEHPFRKLYQRILQDASGKIEQILNTITDIPAPKGSSKQITERKEIWFDKGVRKIESNIRKSKEAYTHAKEGGLRYQVAFATETKIPMFNTGSANGMRLKYRSSLLISEFPDWRFDFTIVRTVERNEFSNIKTILTEFFPKNADIKNFLDSIPPTIQHNIHPELEVEYVGSRVDGLESEIESIVRFVAQSESDQSDRVYQTALGQIADLVIPDKNYSKTFYTKNTLKQLANQPRNFDFATYRNYIVPQIEDFYLSDKADGERVFVYCKQGEPIKYLTTDAVSEGPVYKGKEIIIIDAELLSSGVAMCFDILYHDGTVTHLSFGERLSRLETVVKELGKALKLELKPQIKLTNNYAEEIQEMYDNSSRQYPIDGLIFTPDKGFGTPHPEKSYGKPIHYFDMHVYKFKPPEKQTIDFLIMRAPKSVLGVDPYVTQEGKELMFLFSGISRTQFRSLGLSEPRGYEEIFSEWDLSPTYFPAAFMPSSNPLAYLWYRKPTKDDPHGHVGEFIWQDGGWQLVKMRPDRDTQVQKGIGYGNAYKTAEMTFESYNDPITLEKLTHPENVAYFAVGKSERYKAPTRFNAFVKAQLIRQLAKANMIIDLAAGKGQDLFTIHGMGIKNVLFVDKDKEALVELNNRKYNLGDKKYYVFDFNPAKSMNEWTADADLTQSAEETIQR